MSETLVILEFAGQMLALTTTELEQAIRRAETVLPTHVTLTRYTSVTAPPEPLVDEDAAAIALSISPRWIADSARAGIIPCYRIGRAVRFKISELQAHCRASAGAIPGTDRAAPTDHQSAAARMRLVRQ